MISLMSVAMLVLGVFFIFYLIFAGLATVFEEFIWYMEEKIDILKDIFKR